MKSFVLLIGLVAIATIVSAAPAHHLPVVYYYKLLYIIMIAIDRADVWFNYAYTCMHDFCTVHARICETYIYIIIHACMHVHVYILI